jgi:hypothetical protein
MVWYIATNISGQPAVFLALKMKALSFSELLISIGLYGVTCHISDNLKPPTTVGSGRTC